MKGAVKTCAADGCGNSFVAKSNNHKNCSTTCTKRMSQRRFRDSRREKEGREARFGTKPTDDRGFTYTSKSNSKDGRASARRGPGYDRFRQTEWPDKIISGEASHADAQRALGETGANVSRWMAAYYEDMALGKARKEHEPDLSHTEDLGSFTRRYFPSLLVPDFHLEWEQDIDAVVGTGGKLLLLASQRHGKSEKLIRYCMKRIARNPNISIGWVSKTADLAERMVGYVRQNLDHNERFINDVLGPGQTFQPPTRSGLSWTNGEFTIGNRTEIRKAPTMKAIGVGGTIVGLDFDLIILDDPQDRIRCMSPSQREKDKEWLFTDFLSRKEDHTGVAFIMSRQHVDDLPGNIIRDHDDWIVRTYRAHDPGCTIPEADVEAHVDCVLWPEKRPWKWLYQQKKANEAHFQRNYMNDPRTDTTVLITAEDIDRCKDRERKLGQIPKGVSRLVAGIDPADAKPVAAVLWGFEPPSEEHERGRRHVIDIMEAEAGVRGGREIIRQWKQNYGCSLFVVEKNIAQSWWQDADIRALTSDGMAQVKEHYCVDTETEVLTRSGWKRYDEMIVGEEILTLNIDTGMSEWKPTKDKYVGYYDGVMLKTEGRHIDYLCTPDHSWPVNNKNNLPTKMVDAWRLVGSHRHILSAKNSDTVEPKYKDAFVEVVGWAVTEGHFRHQTPNDTTICIGQSNYANPDYVERIRRCLFDAGAHFTKREDRGGEMALFSMSGDVARAVRAITGDRKHLPLSFIHELSERQRELLLDTMIRADGWFTKGNNAMSYSSNDESLADAVMLLAQLQGRSAKKSLRTDFKNPHWTVYIRHGGKYAPVASNYPETVHWKGTIWCPSTDNGTFFARRNGTTYFTGNTDRHNKWNEATGVVAMFSKMRTDPPTITIPWGDDATRQKMDRLARTFLLFDPDYAGHKHADDDLPMAAWFPQPTMDGWVGQTTSRAEVDYHRTPYVPHRTHYPTRTSLKVVGRSAA